MNVPAGTGPSATPASGRRAARRIALCASAGARVLSARLASFLRVCGRGASRHRRIRVIAVGSVLGSMVLTEWLGC